jgi:hypothetical protein
MPHFVQMWNTVGCHPIGATSISEHSRNYGMCSPIPGTRILESPELAIHNSQVPEVRSPRLAARIRKPEFMSQVASPRIDKVSEHNIQRCLNTVCKLWWYQEH